MILRKVERREGAGLITLLRQVRTDRKLSLEKIARAAGVTIASASRWETRLQRAGAEKQKAVAEFLKVDRRLLFDDDDKAREAPSGSEVIN